MTRLPTTEQVEEVEALIMRNGFEWGERIDVEAFVMRMGRADNWSVVISHNEMTGLLDGLIMNGAVFYNPSEDQLRQILQHIQTVERVWDTTVS